MNRHRNHSPSSRKLASIFQSASSIFRAKAPSYEAKSLTMRLFALPLARRLPSSLDKTPLFYLHAQKLNSGPTVNLDGSRTSVPLITRATEKAAATWAGFGANKEGHWKRRIFVSLLVRKNTSSPQAHLLTMYGVAWRTR